MNYELNSIAATRRSIRKYDPTRPVTDAELLEVIRFAQEAPSWKNKQTSRYYVARTPEAITAVRSAFATGNFGKTEGVGALVVTTFKHNIVGFNLEGQPDNEGGNGWGWYDLGLQGAYFLLKAAEIGLDTLVIGIRDADILRRMMNIPADETVGAVIAVGHRVEDAVRPPRIPTEDIAVFL